MSWERDDEENDTVDWLSTTSTTGNSGWDLPESDEYKLAWESTGQEEEEKEEAKERSTKRQRLVGYMSDAVQKTIQHTASLLRPSTWRANASLANLLSMLSLSEISSLSRTTRSWKQVLSGTERMAVLDRIKQRMGPPLLDRDKMKLILPSIAPVHLALDRHSALELGDAPATRKWFEAILGAISGRNTRIVSIQDWHAWTLALAFPGQQQTTPHVHTILNAYFPSVKRMIIQGVLDDTLSQVFSMPQLSELVLRQPISSVPSPGKWKQWFSLRSDKAPRWELLALSPIRWNNDTFTGWLRGHALHLRSIRSLSICVAWSAEHTVILRQTCSTLERLHLQCTTDWQPEMTAAFAKAKWPRLREFYLQPELIAPSVHEWTQMVRGASTAQYTSLRLISTSTLALDSAVDDSMAASVTRDLVDLLQTFAGSLKQVYLPWLSASSSSLKIWNRLTAALAALASAQRTVWPHLEQLVLGHDSTLVNGLGGTVRVSTTVVHVCEQYQEWVAVTKLFPKLNHTVWTVRQMNDAWLRVLPLQQPALEHLIVPLSTRSLWTVSESAWDAVISSTVTTKWPLHSVDMHLPAAANTAAWRGTWLTQSPRSFRILRMPGILFEFPSPSRVLTELNAASRCERLIEFDLGFRGFLFDSADDVETLQLKCRALIEWVLRRAMSPAALSELLWKGQAEFAAYWLPLFYIAFSDPVSSPLPRWAQIRSEMLEVPEQFLTMAMDARDRIAFEAIWTAATATATTSVAAGEEKKTVMTERKKTLKLSETKWLSMAIDREVGEIVDFLARSVDWQRVMEVYVNNAAYQPWHKFTKRVAHFAPQFMRDRSVQFTRWLTLTPEQFYFWVNIKRAMDGLPREQRELALQLQTVQSLEELHDLKALQVKIAAVVREVLEAGPKGYIARRLNDNRLALFTPDRVVSNKTDTSLVTDIEQFPPFLVYVVNVALSAEQIKEAERVEMAERKERKQELSETTVLQASALRYRSSYYPVSEWRQFRRPPGGGWKAPLDLYQRTPLALADIDEMERRKSRLDAFEIRMERIFGLQDAMDLFYTPHTLVWETVPDVVLATEAKNEVKTVVQLLNEQMEATYYVQAHALERVADDELTREALYAALVENEVMDAEEIQQYTTIPTILGRVYEYFVQFPTQGWLIAQALQGFLSVLSEGA